MADETSTPPIVSHGIYKCGASTVEARKDLATTRGNSDHEHAGTIAHVCMLDKDHGARANPWCECACGHRWKKIG